MLQEADEFGTNVMTKPTRYWIEFSDPPLGNAIGLGCGISALDEAQTRHILEHQVFSKLGQLQIKSIQIDVDIRTLNPNKVIPNMGDVTVIGVWFPQGF